MYNIYIYIACTCRVVFTFIENRVVGVFHLDFFVETTNA